MSRDGSFLGVIPARGGSKGIPRKNIMELGGQPLLAYTIEASRKSKLLDRCLVSTDDEEIVAVARKFRGNVPFLRPSELATDSALTLGVVLHALKWAEKEDQCRYSHIVLLQPTTPFRSGEDIDRALTKLIDTQCDSVISVVDVGAHHPARMYRIVEGQMVSVMDEGVAMKPRQELEPVYIRNGAIYAFRRGLLFEEGQMIGQDCRPYVMPPERSINIDTLDDFRRAASFLESGTRGS